jgi:hypothetical protein
LINQVVFVKWFHLHSPPLKNCLSRNASTYATNKTAVKRAQGSSCVTYTWRPFRKPNIVSSCRFQVH